MQRIEFARDFYRNSNGLSKRNDAKTTKRRNKIGKYEANSCQNTQFQKRNRLRAYTTDNDYVRLEQVAAKLPWNLSSSARMLRSLWRKVNTSEENHRHVHSAIVNYISIMPLTHRTVFQCATRPNLATGGRGGGGPRARILVTGINEIFVLQLERNKSSSVLPGVNRSSGTSLERLNENGTKTQYKNITRESGQGSLCN